MRSIKKAIYLAWPFFILICSCSSSKKHFYYFDHQQVKEIEEVRTIERDTPVVYASIEPVIVQETIVEKIDSIPAKTKTSSSPSLQEDRKEIRRKNFAVAGVVAAPVSAIVSFIYWPVALGLAIIGITLSIIGLRRKKKTLAIVGLILGAIAAGVALFVANNPILQPGDSSIGPLF